MYSSALDGLIYPVGQMVSILFYKPLLAFFRDLYSNRNMTVETLSTLCIGHEKIAGITVEKTNTIRQSLL